jgi:hypothetical protein
MYKVIGKDGWCLVLEYLGVGELVSVAPVSKLVFRSAEDVQMRRNLARADCNCTIACYRPGSARSLIRCVTGHMICSEHNPVSSSCYVCKELICYCCGSRKCPSDVCSAYVCNECDDWTDYGYCFNCDNSTECCSYTKRVRCIGCKQWHCHGCLLKMLASGSVSLSYRIRDEYVLPIVNVACNEFVCSDCVDKRVSKLDIISLMRSDAMSK